MTFYLKKEWTLKLEQSVDIKANKIAFSVRRWVWPVGRWARQKQTDKMSVPMPWYEWPHTRTAAGDVWFVQTSNEKLANSSFLLQIGWLLTLSTISRLKTTLSVYPSKICQVLNPLSPDLITPIKYSVKANTNWDSPIDGSSVCVKLALLPIQTK